MAGGNGPPLRSVQGVGFPNANITGFVFDLSIRED